MASHTHPVRTHLALAPSLPPLPPLVANLLRLARAAIAGAMATVVDLGTLALVVGVFHATPRAASIPALVAGGVANFLGNRHFAFRATDGSLARQAVLYALTEVVALALNGLLFDTTLRLYPQTAHAYVWVRLATSHLVFLAFSYPLWTRVFAPRVAGRTRPASSASHTRAPSAP